MATMLVDDKMPKACVECNQWTCADCLLKHQEHHMSSRWVCGIVGRRQDEFNELLPRKQRSDYNRHTDFEAQVKARDRLRREWCESREALSPLNKTTKSPPIEARDTDQVRRMKLLMKEQECTSCGSDCCRRLGQSYVEDNSAGFLGQVTTCSVWDNARLCLRTAKLYYELLTTSRKAARGELDKAEASSTSW